MCRELENWLVGDPTCLVSEVCECGESVFSLYILIIVCRRMDEGGCNKGMERSVVQGSLPPTGTRNRMEEVVEGMERQSREPRRDLVFYPGVRGHGEGKISHLCLSTSEASML